MARPNLPLGQGTRVFTGARCIFLFNGDVVGFASGVSGSEEILYDPVETLDHLEIREHAPIGYRTTLSASVFRTVSIGSGNDTNQPGSLKQQQIFPYFEDIFRIQGVTAIIQDDPRAGSGGQVLAQWEGVKTASYNFNISARAVVGQNVQFVAIRMRGDADLLP